MASEDADKTPFHPALARKLLQLRLASNDSKQQKKISNEALVAAGELLKIFVTEARNRAAVEAECENEGKEGTNDDDNKVLIQPHHISKIAAELLMDFS
jgi:hypothetical protein